MVDVGTHEGYVREMLKSILEGKVRKLTSQEMMDWHGPTHYITTFAVVKTRQRDHQNSRCVQLRNEEREGQAIVEPVHVAGTQRAL